ncbi:hypothetical protein F52700_2474 [Fusarium sp. NRRL 52700]|nr:hypothetical protein F52700_2474 [Fusarium sp. NRRL 52700]
MNAPLESRLRTSGSPSPKPPAPEKASGFHTKTGRNLMHVHSHCFRDGSSSTLHPAWHPGDIDSDKASLGHGENGMEVYRGHSEPIWWPKFDTGPESSLADGVGSLNSKPISELECRAERRAALINTESPPQSPHPKTHITAAEYTSVTGS